MLGVLFSVARTELCCLTKLCCLTAREDLPLYFDESDAYPRFIKSSRQTTARDSINHYNGRMESIIEMLKSSILCRALMIFDLYDTNTT
jgi:hypothetical protein